MEGKRLGLHTKSLIAVPNHMTLQFANDFLKLYPNANILVAGKQDFSKSNRQKLCAKIATGNFDAVIIGHSQLLKIPVSKEREEKYIQNQIDELVMHIANVQKTQDLYLKCQYINDITDGKGIVFATGTPISNSISEAYIMNKYLKPQLLDENSVGSFDAWIANFAQRVTKLEFSPTGKGFRQKTRISKFNNLPELMKMFKEFSDIKMAEDLNLEAPECERIIINAPRSEIQKELMDSLAKRAEAIQNKEVSPEIDNMLKLTTDGTKIGLDPRLINDMLPDFPDSKVNKCINNVYEIYNQTADEKLTQVIFCDYSTPKYNGEFTVYEDIKQKLVDMGIPKEQVVFIHDCKNDKQKQKLFDKVKNGDVRILLGSTEKMGAGTNIQNRLYAMHHLDAPWKPRDMEQRLGRMKRQGNINENVYEYIYVSQDTFDAYRFQTLETKQGYISQIMTNGNPLRSCDDVSPEEMSFAAVKAACVGNPLIKEKMELDIEVNNFQTLKTAFLNSRYRLEDDVSTKIPKKIDEAKTHYENTKKDIENVNKYPLKYDADGNTVFYGMTICGKLYSDKKEAAHALMETIPKLLTGNEGKAIDIGTYKDFKLQVLFDALYQEMKMRICGHETYTILLSNSESGNIMRIDNKINAIPEIAEECKIRLNTLTQQLADAKAELEKPFPQEAELKEKLQRLDYLNVELSKNDGDKLLGENNSKSFELATEEEKKAAEEREKQRKEKELNGDIDFDL